MHVASLEIEAGGEASLASSTARVGFGAGFLETVEQVAAALTECGIMLSPALLSAL